MSEAETILKMIKTVDPEDTAKLDEIDAQVWCFHANGKFIGMAGIGTFYQESYSGRRQHCLIENKYTRSRDR
jgi:hypothetical protein